MTPSLAELEHEPGDVPGIVDATVRCAVIPQAVSVERLGQTPLVLQRCHQSEQVFDIEMRGTKRIPYSFPLTLSLELSPIIISIARPGPLSGAIALLQVSTGFSERQSLVHLRLCQGRQLCTAWTDAGVRWSHEQTLP